MSQQILRQSVDRLIKQKDDIELLIDVYQSQLLANKATLHSPSLITSTGFPRDDIDILAIRTARQGLIRANNDLRRVVDELGRGLEGLIPAKMEKENKETQAQVAGSTEVRSETEKREGFARVNSVVSNSPAALSGLKPHDIIIQFQQLTKDTMTSLNDIAGIVNLSEGSEIQITVLRPRFRSPSDSNNESNRGEPDEEEINLILIPRTGWGGRGMLGCHILPV